MRHLVDEAAADTRLTHKARGILLTIAIRPPGAEIDPKDLSRDSADGPDAVLSGLQELTAAGYLTSGRRNRSVGRGRAPIDYRLAVDAGDRVA